MRKLSRFSVEVGFVCSTKLSCCAQPIQERSSFEVLDPGGDWLNISPGLPVIFHMYTDKNMSVVTDTVSLVGRQK